MALKLITPAATYPVSLEEVKAWLNVDFADQDALVQNLMIPGATAHAEKYLGRALVDQIWELTLDAFPTKEIEIRRPPLIEVLSVKYDDSNGDEQTVSPSDYFVDAASEPGWVTPNTSSWPSTIDAINSVRVRFRAGYLDSSVSPPVANVPADIRGAIAFMVGTFFANRETVVVGQTVTQLPWAAEQLLRLHRFDLSMA